MSAGTSTTVFKEDVMLRSFILVALLMATTTPTATSTQLAQGDQIRLSDCMVRHTDPTTGRHSFSLATPEQMAAAAIPSQIAACLVLQSYQVIKAPVSWIETVRFFTRLGKARVAVTTTFYFDAPNDYHLFVLEYDGTNWVQVYSGQYANDANQNGNDVGDLNGDNLPDIVVGHATGITAFLDDGAGSYTRLAPESGDAATVLLFADVNGDSNLDVISLPWSGDITVRLGDGTGKFPSGFGVPGTFAGYNDMELGDVDNDGKNELLVTSGQADVPNVTVYELAPGLPFVNSYQVATPHQNSAGIAALDISADGRTDVALSRASNQPDAGIWTYEQSVTGQLIEPPDFVPSYDIPESLEVGDLLCSRHPGLVVAHGGWLTLGFFPVLPTGGFDFEILCPLPYASHYDPRAGIAVGDGDGDKALDVFVAEYNNGVLWLRGTTPCCVAGAPPDQLLAIKAGANKDVQFYWTPVSLASAGIWRGDAKTAIPGMPTGAVKVCSGPSPSCTATGEISGPPESFFQALGDPLCLLGKSENP